MSIDSVNTAEIKDTSGQAYHNKEAHRHNQTRKTHTCLAHKITHHNTSTQELSAIANECGQQQLVRGEAKHIAMHQLPAIVLLLVFVVTGSACVAIKLNQYKCDIIQ